MSFSEFGLNQGLVASLNASGYENPTQLQKQIIPLITQREELIVGSQTAAGKTGAFLIPMVSYLLDNPVEEHQGTRILILTSRRDRVNHINYTLKRIIKDHSIRIGFISGGRPYQHQMRLLKRPLDVLIATPGRLNDLVENNKANFSNLETLFIDDYTTIHYHNLHGLCEKVLEQTTKKCQTVAFFQKDDKSEESLKTLLPKAQEIEVAEEKHPLMSIPQEVYIADDHTHKIALMDQMLDELEDKSILVYTSSNKSADSLAENMENHGHTVELAHELTQTATSSDEHPSIIVSDQSNVDIANSSYTNIIHFELPRDLSVFQSRIVNKGWDELEKPAAIIVGPHDRTTLKKMESETGKSFEQNALIGLEPLNTYISTPKLSLSKKKPTGKKQKQRAGGNKRKGTGHLGSSNRKNNNRQKSHKGPYGRLNGGIHRKRGNNSNNNNSGGNGNQQQQGLGQGQGQKRNNANRNHSSFGSNNINSGNSNFQQSSFSEPVVQERQPKKRNVVIRYKDRKRRTSDSDNAATDDSSVDTSQD